MEHVPVSYNRLHGSSLPLHRRESLAVSQDQVPLQGNVNFEHLKNQTDKCGVPERELYIQYLDGPSFIVICKRMDDSAFHDDIQGAWIDSSIYI